jgi:hypothetical protein
MNVNPIKTVSALFIFFLGQKSQGTTAAALQFLKSVFLHVRMAYAYI